MFLPSETARMVLSYMLDTPNLYPKTIDSFLSECPHLAELVVVAGKDHKEVEMSPFCKVGWKTLKEVLTEYSTIVTKLHDEAKKNGMKDSYMEPISRVLDVVMNIRDHAQPSPIPLVQMKTANSQTEVYPPPVITEDIGSMTTSSTTHPVHYGHDSDNQEALTSSTPPIGTPSLPLPCTAMVDNQVWYDTSRNDGKNASKVGNGENNAEFTDSTGFNKSVPTVKLTPNFSNRITRKSSRLPSKTLPSIAGMFASSNPPVVESSCAKVQSYRRSDLQISKSASKSKVISLASLFVNNNPSRDEQMDLDQIRGEEEQIIKEPISDKRQSNTGLKTTKPLRGSYEEHMRTLKEVTRNHPVANLSSNNSPKTPLRIKDKSSLLGVRALGDDTDNDNIGTNSIWNTCDKDTSKTSDTGFRDNNTSLQINQVAENVLDMNCNQIVANTHDVPMVQDREVELDSPEQLPPPNGYCPKQMRSKLVLIRPKLYEGAGSKNEKERELQNHRRSQSTNVNPRLPVGDLGNSENIVRSERRKKLGIRCGKCEKCRMADCGNCKMCKNKVKFGGDGRMKQACSLKICNNRKIIGEKPKEQGWLLEKVGSVNLFHSSKDIGVKFNDDRFSTMMTDLKPVHLSDKSEGMDGFVEDSQDTSYDDDMSCKG